MSQNDQIQAAARNYENRCDCCGNDPDTDRLEALESAIKFDPSFIAEAIGNQDLTQLVEAYQKVDHQLGWDAIYDMIDAHYKQELRFLGGDVDKLAAAFGVEA